MPFIPPAGASLQLVPIHNSKFKISFAASTLTHPSHYSHYSHNRPCGSHPRWRKLAACAQFKIHNSKFKFPSHYLEHIIGFKNAFLYGVVFENIYLLFPNKKHLNLLDFVYKELSYIPIYLSSLYFFSVFSIIIEASVI